MNRKERNMNLPATRQRGFSLLELVITMAIAVVLLAAILKFFTSSKQNAVVQDSITRVQENARIAIQTLTEDVRAAGFMGEIKEYWNIEVSPTQALPSPLTGECFNDVAGGGYRWVAPFVSVGNNPPLIPPKLFGANDDRSNFSGCIAAANYQANTDLISIHYVGPERLADSSFAVTAGAFYQRTNLYNGIVFRSNGTNPPGDPSWTSGPNNAVYVVKAMVYYVRPCTNAGANNVCGDVGDDTTPALVRTVLKSDGSVQTEAVAEGVVSLQVRYGIDSSVPRDGIVNRYLDANNGSLGDFRQVAQWDDWAKVRTVRIWLLLRTLDNFPGYVDSNSYTLGDKTITPQAGYRYQLYSTTIGLRNFSGDE